MKLKVTDVVRVFGRAVWGEGIGGGEEGEERLLMNIV